VVRNIAEKLAGQAAVVQINTQENPALASRFSIRGIPATILFKQGRVIDQLAGAQSLDVVLSWFRRKSVEPQSGIKF
jgi:thioredoxin 2